VIPELDDVAGEWMAAADLAHLPSLRNQWGQGHVNHDLSSLSWLAAPPYSFGYHTGVLRLDGVTLPAQRFRWHPWGVRREHATDAVRVHTDTRMVLAQDLLLWRIDVTNNTEHAVDHVLSQDLFAMVAHTETGWGWLYDVPWTAGNYHDFMTLERIRAATRDDTPYLLAPGPRRLRLGRPRLPGIQRDADTEAMSLAYELPRHVSTDSVYPHRHGAVATVRLYAAEFVLGRSSEVVLDSFELRAGQVIELELRLDEADQTGIVLTHGNHPDSLQLGVEAGRLWFGIAGEKEYAADEIVVGRWYSVALALDDERVTLRLDGEQVAATRHWSASSRWKSLLDGAFVNIVDGSSPARVSYAFDTVPDALDELGAGARATWTLRLAAGETRSIGIACAYGRDAIDVATTASAAVRDFPGTLAGTERAFRELWHGMFTPGNPHFSGHLPVLEAADPGIAKSYYMGALLALYLRNTRVSAEPAFLTGGPRLGPTATFFWDHSEWSRLYALLEPVGLRGIRDGVTGTDLAENADEDSLREVPGDGQ